MKELVKTYIIKDYIKEKNLTKTEFYKRCKISIYTLNKILSRKNFEISALFKIAKVLELEVYQLFY